MSILEKIRTHCDTKSPFVAYRKPNEELVSAFFQQSDELFFTENYQESGFVFAPFDDSEKAVLIPKSDSDFIQQNIDILTSISLNVVTHPSDEHQKQQHIQLVEKGIEAIKKNQFKKVVLSRKEKVELTNFNVIETFQRLLANYPNAFVYVWFHPKIGLWLGATPETLVKFTNNEFETMALAGTQLYKGMLHVEWQQKEIEEQQFVTDFIVDSVKSISKELTISDVETVKAGSLLHLRTKITGKLNTENSELIRKLHPTPAVCGLPKQVSKEFILNNEHYKREFYTGFLGELNLSKKSNLFVNLRCMQIRNNNTACVYVGGGITKDSNAEKEWNETVAKSSIIKSVL